MNFIIYTETNKKDAEGLKSWRSLLINHFASFHVKFLTAAALKKGNAALLFSCYSSLPVSPKYFFETLPMFTMKHYVLSFDFETQVLYVFKNGKYIACELDTRTIEEAYAVIDFPNLPTERFVELSKGFGK